MDEDVQKALKQILMMCKMPSQANEASWDKQGVLYQKHVVRHTVPPDEAWGFVYKELVYNQVFIAFT